MIFVTEAETPGPEDHTCDKYSFPDAMLENTDGKNTDAERQVLHPERQDRPDTRTRQDLRDDKIGTDQGESDAPPTPTKYFFPDAPRSTQVIRERFHRYRTRRTLHPETGP